MSCENQALLWTQQSFIYFYFFFCFLFTSTLSITIIHAWFLWYIQSILSRKMENNVQSTAFKFTKSNYLHIGKQLKSPERQKSRANDNTMWVIPLAMKQGRLAASCFRSRQSTIYRGITHFQYRRCSAVHGLSNSEQWTLSKQQHYDWLWNRVLVYVGFVNDISQWPKMMCTKTPSHNLCNCYLERGLHGRKVGTK